MPNYSRQFPYPAIKGRSIFVPLIIIANISVFVMWYLMDQQFMATHFLVSWESLIDGRYWTLLGSVFSHNLFFHIFFNMYVLHSFGSIVERVLGSAKFLNFYLVAGAFSSFVHAYVSAHYLKQPELSALGASGAVAGVVLLFSLRFPKEKILILGIIPMPAIGGALLLIGLDVWGLVSQIQGGGLPIGHGAHIGGAVAGIIYFILRIRPRKRGSRRVGI